MPNDVKIEAICGHCLGEFRVSPVMVPKHANPKDATILCRGSGTLPVNQSDGVEHRLMELASEYRKAEDSAHKAVIEGRMMEMTRGLDCHPHWWEFPCECDECWSYGEPA